MKTRTKVDILLLTLVLVAAAIAIPNAQAIGDRWHSLTYSPPPEIAKLAADSGMSKEGRELFYRFSPRLVSGEEMERSCLYLRLGCVEGTSIFILEGEGGAHHNQSVVTAAHEMLHVAYARLEDDEKRSLHKKIDYEFKTNSHKTTQRRLEEYLPEEHYNEAHSLLGSEVQSLESSLDDHYARYFSDRTKTTEAYTNSPDGKQH